AGLPFVQAHWCGAEGIDKVVMASDYVDMNFGSAYGRHIKELGWESRAVCRVCAGRWPGTEL
ncbi:MAG TPA: hypothetical protein VFU22_04645, partial [Roseiflexaceae bacterium]|nr:hypothetical protein [Roseiflexaceae bacterium]